MKIYQSTIEKLLYFALFGGFLFAAVAVISFYQSTQRLSGRVLFLETVIAQNHKIIETQEKSSQTIIHNQNVIYCVGQKQTDCGSLEQ